IAYRERRSAVAGDAITHLLDIAGSPVATLSDKLTDGVHGSFAKLSPLKVDAAHARIGRERDKRGLAFGNVAATKAIFLFGQDHNRAALRRFIGQAGQLGSIRQLFFADTIDREEFNRLPVAHRD